MVEALAGETEAGLDVFGFKVRHLLKDLRHGQAVRQQVEEVAHSDMRTREYKGDRRTARDPR